MNADEESEDEAIGEQHADDVELKKHEKGIDPVFRSWGSWRSFGRLNR